MDYSRENSPFSTKISLQIKGDLKVWDRSLIMGILNLTPDSFYDGGAYESEASILNQVELMLNEGADLIDIGAFSSRPNAQLIDEAEELKRLIPSLKRIAEEFPEALLSIDTYRSAVAKEAIAHGAAMINDISGGTFDPNLPKLMAELNTPYIIMHMQGKPENMQDDPTYQDVTKEIFYWLNQRLLKFRQLGVKDLIVDVGFGFGKSIAHNYRLLKELAHFQQLDCPILVGLSRKGMIQKLVDVSAKDALNGSTVGHTLALLNGANILRVHDVKAAKEAQRIVDFYQKQ